MAENISVKLEGDGSSLNRSLKEITQEGKTLASELKKVKSSFDENTTAQEKGAKIAEVVTKQVKNQEEYVAKLKDEYQRLTEKEGDNTLALSKQQEKINKAETALNQMNAELKSAQDMADGYGDEAEEAAESTGHVEEAAKLLASSKLAEFYNAVSEAAQKMASAAYDAAKELDDGYDTIITKTGASGEALESLQASADKVFSSMPADMADVGTAIGEVNTRFGTTGEELEGLSELFLQFSNITGADVNGAIGSTSRLLKTFGADVKDADKILGYFAKQGMDTGVDVTSLMNALDGNGAVLREMGLDLQESTKLLAMFEANGVDAGGAMAALKKAVANGAKAGKSFDQVMAEASKSIKSASSDTEALQIATELFGAKGAVIMADGIKSGRIALDGLTESMDEYGNVVSDTFEATLDPWDAAKVAMNNLKIAGSELAGEALSTLEPLLTGIVKAIKDATKWFKNLPEPVKKVVAVTGALAAGMGVAVPKIAALANALSMFKAANAIKGLNGVAEAATGAGTAAGKLGTSVGLLSNPLGLAVAGVSAMGLALVGLAAHSDAAIEKEYGLTEAQKALCEAAEAEAQAVREAAAARQEAVTAVNAEYGHIEELAREYDTLIDANGRVKKGYEDRANFILGEMSKATGQSIIDIRNEVSETGSLVAAIQDVIEAKKLEALVSVYDADYADAIKNKATAYQNYADAVDVAKQRQEEYEAVMKSSNGWAQQELEDMQRRLALLEPTSQAYADLKQDIDNFVISESTALEIVRTSKEAWDQSKQAVDDAEGTYLHYAETIQQYEAANAAIISGNEQAIAASLKALSGDYTDAEKQQEKSLKNMVQSAERNLALVERKFRNTGIGEAAVKEAKTAVENARRELDKFYGVGMDAGEGFVRGMKAKQAAVSTAGQEIGKAGVNGVSTGAETHSPSRATMRTGGDIGQGLINGMNAKKGAVKSAAEGVGSAAVSGINGATMKSDWESIGKNAVQGLIDGLEAKKQRLKEKAGEVASVATKATKMTLQVKSPSRVFKEIGQYVVEGFALGMSDISPVTKAIADMEAAVVSPTLTFGADGINGSGQATNYAYGDINVTVNGANIQNDEALADMVSQRIFRQVQAERGAFA